MCMAVYLHLSLWPRYCVPLGQAVVTTLSCPTEEPEHDKRRPAAAAAPHRSSYAGANILLPPPWICVLAWPDSRGPARFSAQPALLDQWPLGYATSGRLTLLRGWRYLASASSTRGRSFAGRAKRAISARRRAFGAILSSLRCRVAFAWLRAYAARTKVVLPSSSSSSSSVYYDDDDDETDALAPQQAPGETSNHI